MARHDGLHYTGSLLHAAEHDGLGGNTSESGDVADGPSVELADEGHLVLVLPPGEVITGSMAGGIAEKIDRLAAVHRFPLLLTLTGVESISRSARDVFSASRSLSAVAVIGVSPVDRVIANFLLGGEVQPCPTRYFSQEDAALNWLKRHAG